jgi:hypothetical protein
MASWRGVNVSWRKLWRPDVIIMQCQPNVANMYPNMKLAAAAKTSMAYRNRKLWHRGSNQHQLMAAA